jgi:hypothetical protein
MRKLLSSRGNSITPPRLLLGNLKDDDEADSTLNSKTSE